MKAKSYSLWQIQQKLFAAMSAVMFVLMVAQAGMVWAASTPQFSQTINDDGSLSVDIVNSGGTTVGSPSVTFGAKSFSFSAITDATGTLGASEERIRVTNGTSTATWTLSMAASATTAVWTDGGSNTYDFNDTGASDTGADVDSVGGQLTVDPSGATVGAVSPCASTTNVAGGSSTDFLEGTRNTITLATGGASAATYCRWDITGISLTQIIPAAQAPAAYTISFALTVA